MSDTMNGAGIEIFGKLSAKLGDVAESMKQQVNWQKMARKASTPVDYTYADTITIPANGFGVIRLTGPDQGHIWYVRRLIIGGLTPTTVAAGRADAFRSASDGRSKTALNQFSITDWKDQATALPFINTYARGGFVLRMNEELIIVVSGATAGQQYVASCDIEDMEEAALKQVWAE